jgi:polysaccharide pyruvyl transferase WcaK-like protein
VPCDLEAIGGSRGDEAMIFSVIQHFREIYPDIPVTILSATEHGCQYVEQLPLTDISSYYNSQFTNDIRPIAKVITETNPSHAVVLGADCMDGHYSPIASAILLYSHRLLTAAGVDSILTGFSFNTHPNRQICRMFNDGTTTYCLRDPESLRRFLIATKAPARLTADIAFMLYPVETPRVSQLTETINAIRNERHGAIFIGFNYHSMFSSSGLTDDNDSTINAIADNFKVLLEANSKVNIIMIPHDDRPRLTDLNTLRPIYQKLIDFGFVKRVRLIDDVWRAVEIKALCRQLDGVISGRMHLAIAAMGMTTPVFTITYQGKFAGLYQHFGYPCQWMSTPENFLQPTSAETMISFVDNIGNLKSILANRLSAVESLSKSTFL